MITPKKLKQAFDNTKFHRSQIQGFQYGERLVIRDLTLSPGSQEIWFSYTASDDEMSDHMDMEGYKIVCEELERLNSRECDVCEGSGLEENLLDECHLCEGAGRFDNDTGYPIED